MHGEAKADPPPRNSVNTRGRILTSAQRAFSSMDYSQAKISDIAKDAGVTQALVIRYFESKEKLFETALSAAIRQRWTELDVRIEQGRSEVDVGVDRRRFGELVAEQMIYDELSGPDPFAMAVYASSNPSARAIATALLKARMVKVVSKWLGEEPATVRATEVLAMCAGLFAVRRLLPLDPAQGDCDPQFRSWFVAAVQAIADCPASDVPKNRSQITAAATTCPLSTA